VLGGALASPIQERWEDSNAYQRQVDALQLERQQTALTDWQAQQQATAASRALVSNAGYLGVLLVGAVALMLGVDFYRQRRTPLIRPDRYGQLPVSRAALVDGEYKQLVYQIAVEVARVHQLQAIHQPGQMPANLHQHVSQAPRLPDSGPSAPQLGASEAPAVLPFSTLLERGRVGKGNPLMLGYDVEDSSEIERQTKELIVGKKFLEKKIADLERAAKPASTE